MRATGKSARIFTLLLVAMLPARAWAQYGGQHGGFGPGGMPPPTSGAGDEPREEGPAEAAPDEDEQPADLQPLGGYPGQRRRRTQIIELDGYLRLRSDFLHNFNLGQGYVLQEAAGGSRPPPFPLPLECGVMEGGCSSKNLGSANLRMRLEPTINVTDQVRVMAQIDVFDNTIMGGTPDSLVSAGHPEYRGGMAAASILSNTQDPPELGRNGAFSSVRAKRAWGEVDTEYGSLRFGRMPWHFGRGITFNSGSCPDCNGGTTVDRLMALTQIYGHQIALSWDFGAQGYNTGMTDLGRVDPESAPLDLSQRDDVFQLMAAITHIDDERHMQEKLDRGDLVFNYGAQLVYRDQRHEVFDLTNMGDTPTPPELTGSATAAAGAQPSSELLAGSLRHGVDGLVVLPSLWMKLAWKSLTVEFESDAVLGRMNNAGPLVDKDTKNKHLSIKQLGWVLASELRLYKNAFVLGFEAGGATGDQAENPRGYLNYRWKTVTQPRGDGSLNDFKFSPDYHVDEILFRRILGTVTNAYYFKPQMTYWMNLADTRQMGISASFIYSIADQPVSTPGNSLSYGLETDLGLNYRNPTDGFYAGFVWGILWPLGALDRPSGTINQQLWPRNEDASAAQVLRIFLGVKF